MPSRIFRFLPSPKQQAAGDQSIAGGIRKRPKKNYKAGVSKMAQQKKRETKQEKRRRIIAAIIAIILILGMVIGMIVPGFGL